MIRPPASFCQSEIIVFVHYLGALAITHVEPIDVLEMARWHQSVPTQSVRRDGD